MEPITLITSALTLLSPYLIKSGEKFAEGIGEDLWKLIKKPFTSEEQEELINKANTEEGIVNLKTVLIEKISHDEIFKKELETAVSNAQEKLTNYNQQNINNSGNIEKQINIQDNKGNIKM